MKKIVSLMLVAVMALPVLAQEEAEAPAKATRDYSEYLPQEGDWSLGFNLNPIATFVGNIFNGTIGNALAPLAGQSLGSNNLFTPGATPSMASIMGTYMLTDEWAVRANVGIGVYSWTRRAYVQDDAARFSDPFSTADGLDTKKNLNVGFSASLGAEYRVGKKRVQGVFGIGVTYGCWAINRADFSYYNAVTEANQNPTNGGLYTGVPNPKLAADYAWLSNPRIISEYTAAGTHIAGVYGSVGVECFVAPKIALGLNVNLLLDYQWNPARAEVWEGWNAVRGERQQITFHDTALNDGFTFTTDNIGANLYIAFYFGK